MELFVRVFAQYFSDFIEKGFRLLMYPLYSLLYFFRFLSFRRMTLSFGFLLLCRLE